MQTAIGMFEDAQEAHRAVSSLKQHGYTDQEITLTQGGNESTVETLITKVDIPEQDRRFYLQGVHQGDTLILVRTDDGRAQGAADILAQFHLVDVDSRLTEYQKVGHTDVGLTQLDTDGTVIPVVEEELKVGKRQVQRGGVRIHTTVTERPIEEQVTLREERVHVERHPVDRPVSDADLAAFKESSLELTETAEEAVVSKQARVVEEVVVGKDASERTETVRDTVRKTDVDVQQIPGDTHTTSTSYDKDFHTYYDTNLKNSGYSYEQYAPVFNYGYELANTDRYRNKSWNDIEADARKGWESKNKGTWDTFKDSVQYAWQRATGQI